MLGLSGTSSYAVFMYLCVLYLYFAVCMVAILLALVSLSCEFLTCLQILPSCLSLNSRARIYHKVWKSGKSHQRSATDQQDLCQRRTVMMRQWKFQAGRVLARPSQFCTLLCSNASAPVFLCCNSLLFAAFRASFALH